MYKRERAIDWIQIIIAWRRHNIMYCTCKYHEWSKDDFPDTLLKTLITL